MQPLDTESRGQIANKRPKVTPPIPLDTRGAAIRGGHTRMRGVCKRGVGGSRQRNLFLMQALADNGDASETDSSRVSLSDSVPGDPGCGTP